MTTTRSTKSVAKRDVAAEVTDRIIEALQAGTVPWHKPWRSVAEMPTSLSTMRPYRGVNTFVLAFTGQAAGYSSPYWGTYRQIAERGGQVRKGEHSTMVVFWKIFQVEDESKPDGVKKIPMLRSFNVFNSEQADWPEGSRLPAQPEPIDNDPIEDAEEIVAGYLADGPSLRNGPAAYYTPARDEVTVPPITDHESAEDYYSTLFHELTHSTGHSKRLARKGIGDGTFGRFGDPVYSQEELVAEMGAAMLSAVAGMEQTKTLPNSAAYVANWLSNLRDDPRLVVSAAAQAQRAVDLITGTTWTEAKDE